MITRNAKEMNEIVEVYKLEGVEPDDKTYENDLEKRSNDKEKKPQPIIETAGPLQDLETIGSTQM